jgi:hypothetical protein
MRWIFPTGASVAVGAALGRGVGVRVGAGVEVGVGVRVAVEVGRGVALGVAVIAIAGAGHCTRLQATNNARRPSRTSVLRVV